MDTENEYKKIKTFFITLFSITGVFVTIIAIFSYKDLMALRKDYNDRLEKTESQIKELVQTSERVIDRTENRGVKEIENIKYSVNSIARQEAVDKINETFKYGNIQDLVESAAKKSINEELDKIIETKIKQTENEIYDLIETSLSLTIYMNEITWGDSHGLKELKMIVKNEPNSQKGKLAKKILKIKSNDYRLYYERENGKNLNKYLDQLEIKKENRDNKSQLSKELVNLILSKEDELSTIAIGTMALELLGYGPFEIFEKSEIIKLKEELK